MKVRIFTIISFVIIILLSFITLIIIKFNMDDKNKTNDLLIKDNIKYTANINNDNFILYKNNIAHNTKIKAIRLSEVTPYYERNQTSISKKTVKKWLNLIKEMNANTIIIPYIESPNFYQSIYEYNLENDPIYIIHEIEIDTKIAKTSYNLYDEKVYNDLYERVKRTIDVVHGRKLLLNNKKSHTGLYLADISNYTIGYIVGTDISQQIVAITNLENDTNTSYNGKYFNVTNGSPFECLMSEILDNAYKYELNKYKTSKLFSISSIAETDPFNHHNETNAIINAMTNLNNIKSKYLFASIVAYPDALSYLEIGNEEISDDYYFEYLVKYKEFYNIPIIVSNIGISTSRGISNLSYDNLYDRGGNNEEQQATKLLELLNDIDKSGMNGVAINSFQDDWGQMTAFNMKNVVIEKDNNYWKDVQSSDESFGLMSFESNMINIDGKTTDFDSVKSSFKNSKLDFKITSDTNYLYLYLKTNENPIYIGFDILSNIGSKKYKDNTFNITADFILEINDKYNTELFVNSRYDIFKYNNYFYDNILGKEDDAPNKNTNEFNNIYLLNQKKFLIQSDATLIDGIYYNTGKLLFGKENDNSLSDFYIKDDIIEIRIPWNLININNPIKKTAQGDFYGNDKNILVNISNIKIEVKSDTLDSGVIKYKIPNYKNIKYQEKLKKSYYSIKDYWEGNI